LSVHGYADEPVMFLSQLKLTQFRNISQCSLHFSPQFNVLFGDNGSGKTSVLEALHLLAMGRSFRTYLSLPLIQHGCQQTVVFSSLKRNGLAVSLGLERFSNGRGSLHMNNSAVNAVEMIDLLPVRVITQHSYQLLEHGPRFRRQFLDWGLFHVEQGFFPAWKRLQRCLKQRNLALKAKAPEDEIRSWDKELVSVSVQIDEMRQRYLKDLLPICLDTVNELFDVEALQVNYHRGWTEDADLTALLSQNLAKDYYLGYTQLGPQRADLQLTVMGVKAQDFFSRGQQKMLISALMLGQGLHLQRFTEKQCLFLIDDLAAELDDRSLMKLMAKLSTLQSQIFLTCISQRVAEQIANAVVDCSLFHIERGVITPQVLEKPADSLANTNT
jgi:DNA replication and repair protein RecF